MRDDTLDSLLNPPAEHNRSTKQPVVDSTVRELQIEQLKLARQVSKTLIRDCPHSMVTSITGVFDRYLRELTE